jgi:hypothetical protein
MEIGAWFSLCVFSLVLSVERNAGEETAGKREKGICYRAKLQCQRERAIFVSFCNVNALVQSHNQQYLTIDVTTSQALTVASPHPQPCPSHSDWEFLRNLDVEAERELVPIRLASSKETHKKHKREESKT